MTPEQKMAIKKILDHTCEACGSEGTFELRDCIHEERNWPITDVGVGEEARQQVDAEPYEIACANCNAAIPIEEMDLTDDEFQSLIDLKDAA